MSSDSPDQERSSAQRTVMFGLLFLLLLIAAVILGYVFLGRPKPAPPAPTATAVTPPAAPSDLTAGVAAIFSIPVGWKDNSDNEDGFNIYRQRIDQQGNKDKAGTAARNATSFLDTGTVCGATYEYTVASYNSAGESPASACWQITLPPCPQPADLALKVGDKTLTPDLYLSADGTRLMADQPGQNGVLDLGDVSDTALDHVSLPHPANWIKTGVPVSAGHTYAALMPDGQSVHVLTIDKVDSQSAQTTGIVWGPGGATSGACTGQAPTQEVTATLTEAATQPCSPTAANDCVTPTVAVTPTAACDCQGTTLVCPGEKPVENARQCSKATAPPTQAGTETGTQPSSTCSPNDASCGGTQATQCFCEVANNAWDGNWVCTTLDGKPVSSVVDTNTCPPPVCGNGVVEGSEECDKSKCPNGGTCQSDCTCSQPVCTCIPLPNGGGYCKENRKQSCTP